MKKLLKFYTLFLILIILFACNSAEKTFEPKVKILIKEALSYKIDLSKGIYTVYFMSKPPVDVAFVLTKRDDSLIQAMYYALKINHVEDGKIFSGDCDITPVLMTTLVIEDKTGNVKTIRDDDCSTIDFWKFKKKSEKKSIETFINTIKKIINNKEEIQKALKSDVWYI